MCRNITELRGLQPPATPDEISAAARQYVRKVSGLATVPAAATDAFEDAVREVTEATTRLLAALPARRQPPPTVPPLRRPEVQARLRARSAGVLTVPVTRTPPASTTGRRGYGRGVASRGTCTVNCIVNDRSRRSSSTARRCASGQPSRSRSSRCGPRRSAAQTPAPQIVLLSIDPPSPSPGQVVTVQVVCDHSGPVAFDDIDVAAGLAGGASPDGFQDDTASHGGSEWTARSDTALPGAGIHAVRVGTFTWQGSGVGAVIANCSSSLGGASASLFFSPPPPVTDPSGSTVAPPPTTAAAVTLPRPSPPRPPGRAARHRSRGHPGPVGGDGRDRRRTARPGARRRDARRGRTGGGGAHRCRRATEWKAIAAACPTLRESTPALIGMRARWSAASCAAGDRPGPSAPRSSAIGPCIRSST